MDKAKIGEHRNVSNHRQTRRSIRLQRSHLLGVIALFVLLVAFVMAQSGGAAQDVSRDIKAGSLPSGKPLYGIDFINSAELLADQQQFTNGMATGATWDRYPIYWFYIETSPGIFDWSRQDAAVEANLEYGLELDAILLGTPAFYTTNLLHSLALPYQHSERAGTLSLDSVETARPAGLREPVFTDGDTPGPNKVINPDNKWAIFVAAAVNRYKPGGALAQANNWPDGKGVTVWEMWNEADVPFFWDASLSDYARLLKVGYLAAKHADPNAVVMFGGLAMWQYPDYYDQVLDVYDSDAMATAHGYFHDIMAIHNYSKPERSGEYVKKVANAMGSYGLDKPIWMNESGVPAWDDYPGPTWEPLSPLRATAEEQASFTIQSAFFALSEGVDALYYFQLYDGCGNQPQGTNPPPHDGRLCDANNNYNGKPCAGDAYGLYSNPTDAACFRQHPDPESARPSFAAYKVLTTYVHDVEPYWRKRKGTPIYSSTCPWSDGTQEWIALYQPATQQRIVGLWARCGRAETAQIEATDPGGKAILVGPDGTVQQLSASNGFYSIALPKATNRNPSPGQSISPTYSIGGSPFILIETDYRDQPPAPTATSTKEPICETGIINGGFEDSTGWRIREGAYKAGYDKAQAHSGQRSMRAGIISSQDNLFSYSSFTQRITLPQGAKDQTLKFWLYPQSDEVTSFRAPADLFAPEAATASDLQIVLILDKNDAVLEYLMIERRNDRRWLEYSYDISDHAGKTIQVYFGVLNNGSGGVTGMYVDDVTLGNCIQPTPGTTTTPTATATVTSTPPASKLYLFYQPTMFNGFPLGINGQIRDESGLGMAGVTVRTDKGHETVSDASGVYVFSDMAPGDYTVRPQMNPYSFQPQTIHVSVPPVAVDQDFIAIPPTPTPEAYPGSG